MATAKQIAANRRNAKKSTGPRTEAGKSKSRSNATKHGLTGEIVVLSDENQADFDQLLERLHQQLAPIGELEHALVDRAAICLWRLKRASRIEAEIFEIEQLRQATNGQEAIATAIVEHGNDSLVPFMNLSEANSTAWVEAVDRKFDLEMAVHQRQGSLGAAFIRGCSASDPLGKLCRYEVMIERSLTRALEQLERLQAKRHRLTNDETTIFDVEAETLD